MTSLERMPYFPSQNSPKTVPRGLLIGLAIQYVAVRVIEVDLFAIAFGPQGHPGSLHVIPSEGAVSIGDSRILAKTASNSAAAIAKA